MKLLKLPLENETIRRILAGKYHRYTGFRRFQAGRGATALCPDRAHSAECFGRLGQDIPARMFSSPLVQELCESVTVRFVDADASDS